MEAFAIDCFDNPGIPGIQGNWIFFKKEIFKGTGAGHSHVL